MWQTLLFSFLGGLFGANGIPHFVKGITKEKYPCLLGNTPVPNLVAGWTMFLLSVLFFHWGNAYRFGWPAFGSAAMGALVIGFVHAGPGAFGRKE